MSQSGKLLVVFDLVSTLTDAGPRYVRAFTDICKRFDYPVPDEDEVMEMLGNKNLKQITDHFLGPLDDEDQGLFMQSCNEACDAMLFQDSWTESLFPNVVDTLENLAEEGYTLGIYTGTREDALEDQITYHDIKRLFDERYIRGKDNERDAGMNSRELKASQLESIVEGYRKDCGRDNAPVLVIGDSSADAEATADKGYFFIGFAASERKQEKMQQANVKQVITDFADLPDVIKTAMDLPEPDAPQYQRIKKKHRPGF